MTLSRPPIIEFLDPGMLTSVQDCGRSGLRHLGISRGGSADYLAAAIANFLVGNHDCQSVLECTLIGPTIKFLRPCVFALTGADMMATLDDMAVPMMVAMSVKAGSVLKMGSCERGLRTYIAIAGGVEGDLFFDSRATHFTAKIGGYKGRALRQGDVLNLAHEDKDQQTDDRIEYRPKPLVDGNALQALVADYSHDWVLRVVMGPDLLSQENENDGDVSPPHHGGDYDDDIGFHRLHKDMRAQLFGTYFQVMPTSNRMGLRLKRGRPLERSDGRPDSQKVNQKVNQNINQDIERSAKPSPIMYSSAVYPGTVQYPLGGEPILLGCDSQTVGGYPRLLQVIEADMSLIGQIRPMDKIWFRGVSIKQARDIGLQKLSFTRSLLPDFNYL